MAPKSQTMRRRAIDDTETAKPVDSDVSNESGRIRKINSIKKKNKKERGQSRVALREISRCNGSSKIIRCEVGRNDVGAKSNRCEIGGNDDETVTVKQACRDVR